MKGRHEAYWLGGIGLLAVGIIAYSQFYPQPEPNPNPGNSTTVVLGIGQTDPSGTFELQHVYADRVTGLRYYDYPVGGGPGIEATLMIGQEISNGCTEFVKLKSIEVAYSTATFEVRYEPNNNCPICQWQVAAMGYP